MFRPDYADCESIKCNSRMAKRTFHGLFAGKDVLLILMFMPFKVPVRNHPCTVGTNRFWRHDRILDIGSRPQAVAIPPLTAYPWFLIAPRFVINSAFMISRAFLWSKFLELVEIRLSPALSMIRRP